MIQDQTAYRFLKDALRPFFMVQSEYDTNNQTRHTEIQCITDSGKRGIQIYIMYTAV